MLPAKFLEVKGHGHLPELVLRIWLFVLEFSFVRLDELGQPQPPERIRIRQGFAVLDVSLGVPVYEMEGDAPFAGHPGRGHGSVLRFKDQVHMAVFFLVKDHREIGQAVQAPFHDFLNGGRKLDRHRVRLDFLKQPGRGHGELEPSVHHGHKGNRPVGDEICFYSRHRLDCYGYLWRYLRASSPRIMSVARVTWELNSCRGFLRDSSDSASFRAYRAMLMPSRTVYLSLA